MVNQQERSITDARALVASALVSLLVVVSPGFTNVACAQAGTLERIEGMLIGSAIGDAFGGPLEFQEPARGAWTSTDVKLTAVGVRELEADFRMRPYTLRPNAEPFGQWLVDAPAGTVTDDTRFKIIFFESIEEERRPDRLDFARTLLRWRSDSTGVYGRLRPEWLREFAYAARWELGERDTSLSRPPERQWGGIPTMAGQMAFLPVAAFAPGDADSVYKMVWRLNFLDNSYAKDQTAAIVAGLAVALTEEATWGTIRDAMTATDPFGFDDVPWVNRKSRHWLQRAHEFAIAADGSPHRLFALLESELNAETWWESWVPPVVVFACAELVGYNPMATMQLILEFGHDTDSYLQLAGALLGALHGPAVFPEPARRQVAAGLKADYGVSVDDWVRQIAEASGPTSR